MTRLALLALALLLPVSSGAATYSWTDPAGTIHFTDDIGAVPAKYRTKALRQAAGEETGSDTRPAVTAPAPTADAAPTAKAAPLVPNADGGATATPATRFGDRTAAEWQADFRALRGQITALEQRFEQLKKEGGDGNKLLSRQGIADINARSKQLNQEYEATRLRFNQLVEQANKAGLPPEFSQ